MSATLSAPGPVSVLMIASPASNVSLAEDTHVEAGTVVADEQCGQLGLTNTQADAIAGDPRLGDLELGAADAIPVPDADLVVGKTVDGEVLAELAIREVVAPEVLLPIRVRLESGRRAQPAARRHGHSDRPARRHRCSAGEPSAHRAPGASTHPCTPFCRATARSRGIPTFTDRSDATPPSRSAHDQNGALGSCQHPEGHTSEQDPGNGAVSVGADDDHVGVARLGVVHDLRGGRPSEESG